MRKRLNTATALAVMLIMPLAWQGCSTIFSATVTVTEIVDSVMKDWAALSNAHKTTAEIDAKVIAAHNHYREAAKVAQDALIAYKASGDQGQYIATLTALKATVGPIIDLITPLLSPSKVQSLQTKLTKASKP